MRPRSLHLEPAFPHAELVLSGPPLLDRARPAYLSQVITGQMSTQKTRPGTFSTQGSAPGLISLSGTWASFLPCLPWASSVTAPSLAFLMRMPMRFQRSLLKFISRLALCHTKKSQFNSLGTGWGPKWRLYATQTPPCRAKEEPESPAVTAHRSIEVRGTGWRANLVPTDSPHRSTA
mgnify:CR=1 FL=1